MKFKYPTESKPVVGEQAKKLDKAIRKGTSISNEASKATIQRITERLEKDIKKNMKKDIIAE